MKSFHIFFILSFLFTACATPAQTSELPTLTPVQADEPTQTSPAPATETQPAAEPTQAPIEFHHGLAPTMDEFTKVNGKEAIDAIVNQLAQTEQPFGADISPIDVQLITDQQGNPVEVILVCNEAGGSSGAAGETNCLPVASLRYTEGGEEYYVVVLKMKNADGTNGFFRWSVSGGWLPSVPSDILINRIKENPEGNRRIRIELSPSSPNVKDGQPVYVAFAENQENREAMLKFAETDIFPQDFRGIIPGNTAQ